MAFGSHEMLAVNEITLDKYLAQSEATDRCLYMVGRNNKFISGEGGGVFPSLLFLSFLYHSPFLPFSRLFPLP